MTERTLGRQSAIVVYYIVALAWGATLLLPLIWLISTSLKSAGHEFAFPPEWIPVPPRWANYPTALTVLPFNLFLRNTVIIVVANIVGTVLTASLAAYGFARLRFPLRDFWFSVLVGTMLLPWVVTLIPTFILFKFLGWFDTFLPLTVPAWFGGGAFSVFLIRQFFLTIPYELEEASRMDGASYLQTYWHVIMPLARPALATVAIFSFIYHWSDFLAPLIYISSQEKWTIALGLRGFQTGYAAAGGRWNLLMAASTVMVIPMIVTFLAAQRYFIKGISLSGFGGR
jgi:ABC-type glycerol-3-phosphate transport system permease component